MKEGHPYVRKEDLRYYLDQDGRFTDTLGRDYDPRVVDKKTEVHAVFVKTGDCWMEVTYDLLAPGMIARLMDRRDKKFCTWTDTGTIEVVIMAVQKSRKGVWAVQVRRPTSQELVDA